MATSLAVDSYQMVSDVDHVLLRPDMYVGPCDRHPRVTKCYSLDNKIAEKQVCHAEGQEQTFLEILGNAADNVQRSRENEIDPERIDVMVSSEYVVVKNYGMNIAVARHSSGLWIPDLIFGHLRSSSNYDDTQQRMYIGKNGLGAKATNILSKVFSVECADPSRNLLYKQTWTNNMSQTSDPEITQFNGKGYTQIAYSLDFERFGVSGFDSEALEIYAAHCAFVSFTCSVPVYFNGQKLQISSIVDCAKLFFPITKASAISHKDEQYELCIIDTPDNATCVSFVNGIITSNGGVHVDAAYKVVVDSIIEFLGTAVKGISITKRDIVNHVSLFISCRLPNPQFKSQTKDYLSRPKPNIKIPTNILKGIKKWQLIERIYIDIERKQINKMNKTDNKRGKHLDIEGYDTSNWAGKKNRHLTTLMLTEGKSAKGYATTFLSQVPKGEGRNYYGVLPLHGKLLNVLNADFMKTLNNRDLRNIRDVLGLKDGIDYMQDNNFRKLRYGRVLIMADADNDGMHILGLVLLFFMHKYYPLIQRGYVTFLRTPVLRVTKGKQTVKFHTYTSYRKWRNATQNPDSWNHDYYKGLGSSNKANIKDDYKNPKVVKFHVDEQAAQKMILAFHKTEADRRKQWIADWVEREVLDVETFVELPISTFVDYELIEYSIENIIRAIPEAADGLKESQRKALYTAFEKMRGKKGKKDKVCEIAYFASGLTGYKHGPDCLADAITMMTYDFVGSNNLPYFVPEGQFGTRNEGGEDAAHPRYTYVRLPWWIDYVYRKEDTRLEKRIVDEGEKRECENFYPILPMHLINGVDGVGTAYSTHIPAHNPLDLAFWLQQKLTGQDLPKLRPWYKGFTGKIAFKGNGFTTEGNMFRQPDGSIVITELPIGVWTLKYKDFLYKLEAEGIVSEVLSYSTDETVNFVIRGYKGEDPSMKNFRLISKQSYNNMTVLYRTDDRGVKPVIYNNLNDLLNDFYGLRLAKYTERRELYLKELDEMILEYGERARFILCVISGEIEIRNRPEAEIFAGMDRLKFNHDLLDKVNTRELTKERVDALQAKIAKFTNEKDTMSNTKPEQLWHTELEQFIVQYCKHEKCGRSTMESCQKQNEVIEITHM